MMDSQEVISLYEIVATITDQMLTAARNGDWEELAALEARCTRHVATLQAGEAPVRLTGAVRKRKMQIIQKLLSDDREIRGITEPWMEQLSKKMSSVGTERKLNHTYGAVPR